eukprot:CAMPEP_0113944304 /NCGR_PEP_ID=MMETSP1339-20121228/33048_1 /TAXON_ID=94617 /ORGANISM="Fibrocapsa japonica" /LENGTH=221 /DNA_ID=CAMNT_0000949469 /DNA_START=74 /DNA_END=739 /DNA_ORIENTATION=- /assembly_acc=CAM_ASM_000762
MASKIISSVAFLCIVATVSAFHGLHASQGFRSMPVVNPVQLSGKVPSFALHMSEKPEKAEATVAEVATPPSTEAPAEGQTPAPVEGADTAVDGEKKEEEEKGMSPREKEIARLKAAETFITKPTGNWECTTCGYVYKEDEGEYPRVPAGTKFMDPAMSGYTCPNCQSPRSFFEPELITIAGFEENQNYGFFNGLTGDQKSLLIFGGLGFFFFLFLGGYLLE